MKILLAFTFSLLSIVCFTQAISTYPNMPYSKFVSVDMIDDYIVARGNCDQVWSSTDGGATWKYDIIGDQLLTNISLIPNDPSKAVIALREEVIIYDIIEQEIVNSSASSPLELRWGKKILTKGGDIFLLTIGGLFKAVNGEYEWELVFERPAESANFDVADITEEFIFIGSNDGKIYSYGLIDGSITLRSDNEVAIRELTMGTSTIGYVIISGSNKIQKTIDGGVSFTPVNSLNIARNVHAHGEDMVATILGTSLEVSIDGGLTAVQYSLSNSKPFGDIHNGFIADDGSIYAYGKGATIARSIDQGATFQFINPYNRSDLYDVSINEDGSGLACGEFSYTLTTNDHGHTWAPIDLGIAENQTLKSIDKLSNGNVIVGGWEGIHIVENNQVKYTEDVQCNDFLTTSQGTILAHINNQGTYQVIRSADYGMTWETVQGGLSFTPHIRQSTTGDIYILTQSQNVYLSEDDGETWMIVDFGMQFENIYPFDDQIIMGTIGYDLYRSEDGGETWNTIYNAYLIDNIRYLSATSSYFTFGQNGDTYLMFTDDAGANWEQKYQNCTLTNAIALNNDEEVIMAQSTGHINIYSTLIMTSTNEKTREDEKLHIWPNPLEKGNPLQLDTEWTELQIIGLDGQVVLRHQNYNQNIDLSTLKSGIYIIRVQQSGIVRTGKFLLF